MFDANSSELKVGDIVLVPCEVLSVNRGNHPNLLVKTVVRPGEANDVAQQFAIRCGQVKKEAQDGAVDNGGSVQRGSLGKDHGQL